MKVAVTGSTGLIGSALVQDIAQRGHEVLRLVRKEGALAQGEVAWNPDAGKINVQGLQGVDMVVHLAGEDVANGKWNDAKKLRIRNSRVNGTALLCKALASMRPRPKVLVSASAVGYYGNRGSDWLTETSPPGEGFLANVCRDWEAATGVAAQARIRVVNLRFGVVLSTQGGALGRMLPYFKAGLGGVMGSGRQYVSWVTLEDTVAAILHVMSYRMLNGPVNVTSPEPLTNYRFTKTLGAVLALPVILPLPGPLLRLLVGEMAQEVLLASARVRPAKLMEAGFNFRYPLLENALKNLLGKGPH